MVIRRGRVSEAGVEGAEGGDSVEVVATDKPEAVAACCNTSKGRGVIVKDTLPPGDEAISEATSLCGRLNVSTPLTYQCSYRITV